MAKAPDAVKQKYQGRESECDSDCEATKAQVTESISKVQEETDSQLSREIKQAERVKAAYKDFEEQMYVANDIMMQVKEGKKDVQVGLREIEELQEKAMENVKENYRDIRPKYRNPLLGRIRTGLDVYQADLKTSAEDIKKSTNQKDCGNNNGNWNNGQCNMKPSAELSEPVKKGKVHTW